MMVWSDIMPKPCLCPHARLEKQATPSWIEDSNTEDQKDPVSGGEGDEEREGESMSFIFKW